MRIEQLQYFVEVAQSGSFNKAARKFFVTQQGLSDAMKRLETELDMVLFHRKKVGVTLTEEGAFLMEYVQDIIASYERMTTAIAKRRCVVTEASESLSLLISPMLANTILPDLIDLIGQSTKGVKLLCQELGMLEVVHKLKKHSGIGLIACQEESYESILKEAQGQLNIWQLYSDEIMMAVSNHSPLYYKKAVSFEEYQKQTIAGFVQDEYFERAHSEHKPGYISTSLYLHQKLILDNQACGSTPALLAKKLFSSQQIKLIPIRPAIKIQYLVLFSKHTPAEAAQFFMQVVNDYFYSLAGQRPSLVKISGE